MAGGSDKRADSPTTAGAGPRDRRASHRAAIEIPATLLVGGRQIDCSIRNLSTQGIALAGSESVAPGMVVRVVFRLPNARLPVEMAGVMVRTTGGRQEGIMGLQFIEPGADAVRTIQTFVTRNRSDRPFSRGSDGAAGDRLAGLYKRAVSDVAGKPGKRRGLLDRLRRRGKS